MPRGIYKRKSGKMGKRHSSKPQPKETAQDVSTFPRRAEDTAAIRTELPDSMLETMRQAGIAAPATTTQLSAKVRNMITAIREPFHAFAQQLTSLTSTRATLAPQFMEAFTGWEKETKGTFIGFVRVLDASVPADRKGYKTNQVYQAADYLRRLVAVARSPKRQATKTKAASPIAVIAQLAASMLAGLPKEAEPTFWATFEKKFHWTGQRVKTVQAKVAAIQKPALAPSVLQAA